MAVMAANNKQVYTVVQMQRDCELTIDGAPCAIEKGDYLLFNEHETRYVSRADYLRDYTEFEAK